MFIQVIKLSIQIAYRIALFDFVHNIDYMYGVRWDSKGERIVSASGDYTVKIIDFSSGKVIYTGATSDGRKKFNFLVIILLFAKNYIF